MMILKYIENIHFIRPQLLWLFLLLVVFIIIKFTLDKYIYSRTQTKNNLWYKYCSPEILKKLYIQKQSHKSSNNRILLYIIWVLTIVALAGPSWHKKEIPLFQNNNSWILALSLSSSMENADIKPSRLQRAKYKIQDFLKYIDDEQLGLIVYSDEAYDIIPLTTDKKTIDHILPSIEPLIMPTNGNNINAALLKSQELINNLNLKSSNILLLADSNANSEALLLAQELKKQNIIINILNFNKDGTGSFNNSLKELSILSGGLYHEVTNTDNDIRNILAHAQSRYNLIYNQEPQLDKLELWYDMGPYIIIIIVLLILLRIVGAQLMMLKNNHQILLLLPIMLCALSFNNPLYAADIWESQIHNLWNNIWYNKQQQAAQNLINNTNKNIDPKTFSDSKWQAAAEYKNNNFKAAEELFKNNTDLTSAYNYANSLAKQGKLSQAIEQYSKILEQQPKHQDAEYNKNLLETYLKSKDNQQNQDNSSDKKEDNQQNQNKENNNTQGQKEQGSENQQNKSSDSNNKSEYNNQDENTPNNEITDNKLEQEQEQEQEQANNKDNQLSSSEKEQKKWLDKIPDNPAVYLRNQLQYEYWLKKQQNN